MLAVVRFLVEGSLSGEMWVVRRLRREAMRVKATVSRTSANETRTTVLKLYCLFAMSASLNG
jgi:hypothetical protein